MYEASAAFHQAVAANRPQIAMLIFDDAVFTNPDINVENGIEFNDNFNTEDDLSIGQTNSNEITFTLFNDERLLNDYEFGDFLATIGVLVGTDTYRQYGTVTMTTTYASYVGRDSYPYLMRNNQAMNPQPGFVVKSLLGYDGKVWAFSDTGRYAVYDDLTGRNITGSNPLNRFMVHKSIAWSGKGMFYNKDSRILFIYEGGYRDRYEFVPLGYFNAERPDSPDQIEIELTCMDWMQRFEKDMPNDEDMGLTWPMTIGQLFVKLCESENVRYRTAEFINSDAEIAERPSDFDNCTKRQVIAWIAEAAGSNARFDRDGYLVFDWLRETSISYNEGDYETFRPNWYETKQITKLYNRNTRETDDIILGDGDNAYLIQDNPLLKGVE